MKHNMLYFININIPYSKFWHYFHHHLQPTCTSCLILDSALLYFSDFHKILTGSFFSSSFCLHLRWISLIRLTFSWIWFLAPISGESKKKNTKKLMPFHLFLLQFKETSINITAMDALVDIIRYNIDIHSAKFFPIPSLTSYYNLSFLLPWHGVGRVMTFCTMGECWD